jgi:integrase
VREAQLKERGETPGPLFRTRTGKALNRKETFATLQRIARQANTHVSPDEHIHVSPQILRHTLLCKEADEKGARYTMELSGHQSERYTGAM